jgi:hypothetical protein
MLLGLVRVFWSPGESVNCLWPITVRIGTARVDAQLNQMN